MPLAAHERKYVEWQNRATDFYLGARRLYRCELHRPSVYCAVVSLELVLKATLTYWVRGFDPEAVGHALAKLARMVRNKVPNGAIIHIPEYFYFEQRYLTLSRYPKRGKGLGIPAGFLWDLDSIYCRTVELVPFQHNTQLKSVLRGGSRVKLEALRRDNPHVRRLRAYLKVRYGA
jgi:HEPN domain-containing protein